MHYSSRRVPAVLALCAVAAACSSSKGTAPAPTGSMTVTVTSADGATPFGRHSRAKRLHQDRHRARKPSPGSPSATT